VSSLGEKTTGIQEDEANAVSSDELPMMIAGKEQQQELMKPMVAVDDTQALTVQSVQTTDDDAEWLNAIDVDETAKPGNCRTCKWIFVYSVNFVSRF